MGELALIILVGLVVLKPEDLPAFFRLLGRGLSYLRQWNQQLVYWLESQDHPHSREDNDEDPK